MPLSGGADLILCQGGLTLPHSKYAGRYSTVHSTVQYSTVQYCTVQYCTVLYSTVLYCTTCMSSTVHSTVTAANMERGVTDPLESRLDSAGKSLNLN